MNTTIPLEQQSHPVLLDIDELKGEISRWQSVITNYPPSEITIYAEWKKGLCEKRLQYAEKRLLKTQSDFASKTIDQWKEEKKALEEKLRIGEYDQVMTHQIKGQIQWCKRNITLLTRKQNETADKAEA